MQIPTTQKRKIVGQRAHRSLRGSSPAPQKPEPPSLRRESTRILRTVLALATVLGAALFIWNSATTIGARQGFINASIVVMRAPISGTLHLTKIEPGQKLGRSGVVATVTTPRAAQLEIEIARITKQIATSNARKESLESHLAQRRLQLAHYTELSKLQASLDVQKAQHQLERVKHQLANNVNQASLAKRQAERYLLLNKEGAVPLAEADKIQTEAESNAALVLARLSEIQEIKNQISALELGLQLGDTRSLSEPAQMVDRLTREIADIEADLGSITRELASERTELDEINAHIKVHTSAAVKCPIDGVVWSIDALDGEIVNEGAPIIRVLNPNDRWVETFIAEEDLGKIKIGTAAALHILGTNETCQGRVSNIRAGVGRVPAGEYVAVPAPSNIRREAAVRFAVSWLPSSGHGKFDGRSFHGVGQSVDVTFRK